MEGKNAHLRPTGASVLNALFRDYGHDTGFVYDSAELGLLAADAGVTPPAGDCVLEESGFRESRALPAVAAALDDPVKAHESLYLDVVCGAPHARPDL